MAETKLIKNHLYNSKKLIGPKATSLSSLIRGRKKVHPKRANHKQTKDLNRSVSAKS